MCILDRDFKISIAQPKSKGPAGFNLIGIKPTVTDIDTLPVILLQNVAENAKFLGARIIVIVYCPSIGQFTGGRDLATDDVRKGIAALLTALHKVKDSSDSRNFIQNGQIQNSAAVDYQQNLFVVLSKGADICFLHIRQIIIAFF